MSKEELKNIGCVEQTALSAVHEFCFNCAGGRTEANQCTATPCPLWAFRMGKSPYQKHPPRTPQQQKEQKQRMDFARSIKNKKQVNNA